jgi:hypothetical protein
MGLFRQAAEAARDAGGDLDKFAKATGMGMTRYLGVGDHTVTIKGADASQVAAKGQVRFSFEDGAGSTLEENVFVVNKDRTGMSWALTRLLAALFSDVKSYEVFLHAIDEDPRKFSALTGLKVGITVSRSEGFYLKKDPSSEVYSVVDSVSGDVVPDLEGKDAKEVSERAKAAGHKRSYRNVSDFSQVDVDFNIDRLKSALAGGGVSQLKVKTL